MLLFILKSQTFTVKLNVKVFQLQNLKSCMYRRMRWGTQELAICTVVISSEGKTKEVVGQQGWKNESLLYFSSPKLTLPLGKHPHCSWTIAGIHVVNNVASAPEILHGVWISGLVLFLGDLCSTTEVGFIRMNLALESSIQLRATAVHSKHVHLEKALTVLCKTEQQCSRWPCDSPPGSSSCPHDDSIQRDISSCLPPEIKGGKGKTDSCLQWCKSMR